MSLTDAAACYADRAITLAQLRQIAPHAPDSHLDPINASMAHYEINTPRRQAAFLAQVAHESNQFRELVEAWGPTPDQLGYERPVVDGVPAPLVPEAPGVHLPKWQRLGNLVAGDGFRFRGRGAIQLTGRTNYTRAGGVLHLDLVGHPDLAADPRYAYSLAALYWAWIDGNGFADRGDFEGLTRKINGGLNGYQQRLEYYARAARALGAVPESGGQG